MVQVLSEVKRGLEVKMVRRAASLVWRRAQQDTFKILA